MHHYRSSFLDSKRPLRCSFPDADLCRGNSGPIYSCGYAYNEKGTFRVRRLSVDKIEIAGLIMIVISAISVFIFVSENSFPAFSLAENHWKPIEVSTHMDIETARFIWNYRSLDLIAQVFVLFGASLGCLAILRKVKRSNK